MIEIRRSDDRGFADRGWLKSWHSFSFAGYHRADRMGYRALRVVNEDVVAPGTGFPAHPHRDMEIITYVLSGAVAHRDSNGGAGVVRPGEAQYMCAGTGVVHSEYNESKTTPLHLYQIWIVPHTKNLAPGYAQRDFGGERKGRFRLIASADGRDESLRINQDVSLYASLLGEGAEIGHPIAEDRCGWLQVARGAVEFEGTSLEAGDAAIFEKERLIRGRAAAPETELLFFDLA